MDENSGGRVTYSEAVEIMRYMQKYRGTIKSPTLTQAMLLAQYSFPLTLKFVMIQRVAERARVEGREIWSLLYFREAFQKAESDYHKGNPPLKGDLVKVSDILGMK